MKEYKIFVGVILIGNVPGACAIYPGKKLTFITANATELGQEMVASNGAELAEKWEDEFTFLGPCEEIRVGDDVFHICPMMPKLVEEFKTAVNESLGSKNK